MSKLSHLILSFLYHGISNNIHNFITIFTDKKLNIKDTNLEEVATIQVVEVDNYPV